MRLLLLVLFSFSNFALIAQSDIGILANSFTEKCATLSVRFPKCGEHENSLAKFTLMNGRFPDDEKWVKDGEIVSANSIKTENSFRNNEDIQALINSAKVYLESEDLDFTLEFQNEEYKYIHAAQVYLDYKKSLIQSSEVKQNTFSGCILQALGVQAVIDSFLTKMTKQTIIKLVAKLAKRYLGWLGAAIAVIDFIECYYGD